jgi:hypothetical protein
MLINPGHAWIPIFGTGVIYRHCGMRLHHVSNDVLGKRLRHDLDFATDGEPWWACVAFAEGRIAIVPRSHLMPPLPEDQREKMVEVAILANREVHHGGHWVTAISGGMLSALWRDWAGDLQFEQQWPDTWPRLKAMPREEWVDLLETLWRTWEMKVRDIRDPNAQIMRAMGEASKATPPA